MNFVSELDEETLRQLLKIAKRGVDRFYYEGYVEWSKSNTEKLFKNQVDLEDPRLRFVFYAWEEAGIIRFVGRDDSFFVVLQPFPQTE